jgi:hypothetical protein
MDKRRFSRGLYRGVFDELLVSLRIFYTKFINKFLLAAFDL